MTRPNPKPDYGRAVPSVSLYEGQTLLGYLRNRDDGQCEARDANRTLVGVFSSRQDAWHALIKEGNQDV